MLIILEGGDGTGTTTQSQMLFDWLLKNYSQAEPLLTSEPTNGPIGRFIHSILEKKVLTQVSARGIAALFYADRLEHYEFEIFPALEKGRWIICDRNWQSTLVYQGLIQSVVDARWIMNLHRSLIPKNSYCFILDVPPDVTRKRRNERGGLEQLYETNTMQKYILAAYQAIPDWDWNSEVISCGSASAQAVHQMLVDRIAPLLKKRFC
jgi:dTMP kinase